tara:strand:- start:1411 stop:1659 length:249 start_codon:yes stop_codon:yes gene_type:complete
MANRKAKRYLTEADEYVLFTSAKRGDKSAFKIIISSEDAWEVILNLAIKEYPIRETLRNILITTDAYIQSNQNEDNTEGESK